MQWVFMYEPIAARLIEHAEAIGEPEALIARARQALKQPGDSAPPRRSPARARVLRAGRPGVRLRRHRADGAARRARGRARGRGRDRRGVRRRRRCERAGDAAGVGRRGGAEPPVARPDHSPRRQARPSGARPIGRPGLARAPGTRSHRADLRRRRGLEGDAGVERRAVGGRGRRVAGRRAVEDGRGTVGRGRAGAGPAVGGAVSSAVSGRSVRSACSNARTCAARASLAGADRTRLTARSARRARPPGGGTACRRRTRTTPTASRRPRSPSGPACVGPTRSRCAASLARSAHASFAVSDSGARPAGRSATSSRASRVNGLRRSARSAPAAGCASSTAEAGVARLIGRPPAARDDHPDARCVRAT